MSTKKSLKKTMRLVAKDDCEHCQGTGIKAVNEYVGISRLLRVEFAICSCVRVKPIGLFLPSVTPDVSVSLVNQ